MVMKIEDNQREQMIKSGVLRFDNQVAWEGNIQFGRGYWKTVNEGFGIGRQKDIQPLLIWFNHGSCF